jgi:hypothetical protein
MRFAMFIAAKSPWARQLGLAAVAALAIGSVALTAAPAEARVYASVGFPFGAYYAPSPFYYYPAPAVSYGFCGWGWHLVPGHWNRWGRWVPARCRPNW